MDLRYLEHRQKNVHFLSMLGIRNVFNNHQNEFGHVAS